MSENKFIARLKGEPTPKSVVEIQNDRLVAPFKSSPMGHIADRDSSVVVAKGAQNWAVNQGQLVPVADDYVGTESDLSGTSRVSGAGLWLNATYTFPVTGDETNPVSAIIAPSAKWVLTLCGDSLITQNGSVITLTMLVKIGATHLTTKQFKVRECASQFSQRLAIDFSESEQSVIKAHGGSPLTVQVLCDDEGASATIYSGMTHLTLLQRKIDADLVATDNVLLPEFIENLLQGYIIPADYFSRYDYIEQVEDGAKAMPEFTRNGDNMSFSGWAKPAEEVYTKTEIDDKFTIANAQIDANADAIQKTRDDMNEEDGRLQTQITAHAGAITALQNEQTATGNQIQTIESKIPDGTSDTNPLINKQQLLDEEMDIREDLNEGLSELQTQITAQATAIAGKQDQLTAGDNIVISGNVISATGAGGGAGGLESVATDETLKGNGTSSAPLGLSSETITRFEDIEKVIPGHASEDNKLCTYEEMHDEVQVVSDKLTGLRESIQTKDLTVGTSEGALNLSITAGVATIATNNGLYIAAQTKFDTAPTTDDTTTWANANDTSLVTKRQVATALSESGGGDYLPLSGGTLTGAISFNLTAGSSFGNIPVLLNWENNPILSIGSDYSGTMGRNAIFANDVTVSNTLYVKNKIGSTLTKVKKAFVEKFNNGADIAIPTVGGTMARLEDIAAIGGDGTTGQVLTKTDDGMAWQDAAKGGASLPILMAIWSDHVINDMSWLRADTFSWQSGDVYKAAYEHLVEDYENTESRTLYAWDNGVGSYVYTLSESPSVGDSVYDSLGGLDGSDYVIEVADDGIYVGENEVDSLLYTRDSSRDTSVPQIDTIGDITIAYYLADDGHKICLPDQESKIVALYNKTGAADYYILDTTNKQFKLPRKQKRTLIQAVKNTDGTWYNLYSDGWVEQGGNLPLAGGYITYPIAMSSSYVPVFKIVTNRNGASYDNELYPTEVTETRFYAYNVAPAGGVKAEWSVSGYAAESAYASAGMRLEYYYVGNFEQSAIEQTAGLNAELFNGKADVDLSNINASQSAKETIVGWGIPDYTAGVTLTAGVQYTASTDGVIFASYINNQTRATITINGVSMNLNYCYKVSGDVESESLSTIPVAKGDVYTLAAVGGNTIFFFPLKGVK